jgi:hypothetical protein
MQVEVGIPLKNVSSSVTPGLKAVVIVLRGLFSFPLSSIRLRPLHFRKLPLGPFISSMPLSNSD